MKTQLTVFILFSLVVVRIPWAFELPPPAPIQPVTAQCIQIAAQHYHIPVQMVMARLQKLQGKTGLASRNSDGSYELGLMRINSRMVKEHDLNAQQLRDHGCYNVFVGTGLLAQLAYKIETALNHKTLRNTHHCNIQPWMNLVQKAAKRYQLPPALITSVICTESAGKPKALSHAGAMGLMQLMPDTAKRFGVTNAYDPVQNINAGSRYLAWLLKYMKNDIKLALAGYNAGEGAVKKYKWTIPPYKETQNYVKKVMALYQAQTVQTLLADSR